tara:strand:+ start:2358 stop:3419 length:1062 start_codon:yes stop_codon:yes gene_type:complete
MATTLSDIIVPEVFAASIIEETTLRDSFLQSGVVAPLAELNLSSTQGGNFVNIPFYKANLSGNYTRLNDSSSLTPNKIEQSSQIGVVLTAGDAFSARQLAGQKIGSNSPDPISAIRQKLGAYINNEKQKDLYSCLQGVFGSLTANTSDSALFDLCIDSESGDSPSALGAGTVSKAQSLLGDQGDKLTTIAMHSKVFYALKERKALDYVTNTEARLSTAATGASTIDAFGGSSAGAYGDVSVPQYMGMNIVVSDDIPKAGSGASTEYAVYFFAQGSVATGEQAALETLVDRDVLAFEDVVSFKHAYIYHPIGTKWAVTTTNPTRTQLETATNWSKVYDTKNIGIVRATVTSPLD